MKPIKRMIRIPKKQTVYTICLLSNRRRPIFPGSHPPSIVGAKELNYCVRDGNRCDLLAVITGCLPNRISSITTLTKLSVY